MQRPSAARIRLGGKSVPQCGVSPIVGFKRRHTVGARPHNPGRYRYIRRRCPQRISAVSASAAEAASMRYNPVELYHEFLNQMQSASFHDSVVDIEKHDDNDTSSSYYRLDCSCELAVCCSSRKESHIDECRCARCTRRAHTPTPQRPGNGSDGGASPKCVHTQCGAITGALGTVPRLSEGFLHPLELSFEPDDDIDLDYYDDASDDDDNDNDNDGNCCDGAMDGCAGAEGQNPVVPGLFPQMDLGSKTQFVPFSVLPLNPSYVE